ncbi:MAG: hypothetical protein PHQ89_00180 [Bacilli bacterium]|nr:hypothetical protein [Bacilli bacterium]
MKIFISCPFSGILDKNSGLVKKEYRFFFDTIINFLESNNIDYYLAIKREDFGKNYISAAEATISDFQGVQNCDILFVIPGNPISGGVHIELGWASAFNKKIYIFLEKDAKYSPVLMGLNSLTNVTYCDCSKFPSQELLKEFINIIKAIKGV